MMAEQLVGVQVRDYDTLLVGQEWYDLGMGGTAAHLNPIEPRNCRTLLLTFISTSSRTTEI
jgi:hypothetical protein